MRTRIIMEYLESGTLSTDVDTNDMGFISGWLNTQVHHCIGELPWGITGCKPDVSFTTAHNGEGIYLKYFVAEKYHRALRTQINDAVYTDSCVEFFISFPDDKGYYNLEFNSTGVALMGYGTGKERDLVPNTIVKKIRTLTNFQPFSIKGNGYRWELTLAIPFEVFIHHDITGLTGQICRVNFFKCGDELPEPHFMSWAHIINPTPEFHLPEFFGSIAFV